MKTLFQPNYLLVFQFGRAAVYAEEVRDAKENKEVVRKFIEEVFNAKRPDRLHEFFNPDTILHSTPYVGIGISMDESAIDKFVIESVAPGSPADGTLQSGDEIISVADDENSWNTYQELRKGEFGRGSVGSTFTVRVLRDSQTLELTLKHGLIPGFDITIGKSEEGLRKYLMEDWPDLKITIDCIVAEDDLVAAFMTYHGTNAVYDRHAVWSLCVLYRVQDGKIVEIWPLEDEFTRMLQEGYSVQPPVPDNLVL